MSETVKWMEAAKAAAFMMLVVVAWLGIVGILTVLILWNAAFGIGAFVVTVFAVMVIAIKKINDRYDS